MYKCISVVIINTIINIIIKKYNKNIYLENKNDYQSFLILTQALCKCNKCKIIAYLFCFFDCYLYNLYLYINLMRCKL